MISSEVVGLVGVGAIAGKLAWPSMPTIKVNTFTDCAFETSSNKFVPLFQRNVIIVFAKAELMTIKGVKAES